MKRIVQVLYSGLGGHGTVAFSLLDGFSKSHYNNYMYFYGIEPLYKYYALDCHKNSNVSGFYSLLKKTKFSFKDWILFYKYLKKTKADIILLHMPNLIIPAFIYKVIYHKKIISVEHDSISLRTKRKWFVSNLNAVFANKIVILTQPYKTNIYKNLWFKKLINKYTVIPNGIDTEIFKNENKLFTHNRVSIFMASRMNKLRDHDTLIKAVNVLINKGWKIKLTIAGDGETLKHLKLKYENDNILFLGSIDENSIINKLQHTDIYVHSTLAENFSTSILQAMSCKLPIITTNIEGTNHMIINKKNGLLFETSNVNDLVNKILFLLTNNEKAIELGENANKDVERKYKNSIISKKYIELF